MLMFAMVALEPVLATILRAVGGAALASQSPLTTSDLMFCRFSHNTTMQYPSQKDRPQYLPHEFHTSNPAIKTP